VEQDLKQRMSTIPRSKSYINGLVGIFLMLVGYLVASDEQNIDTFVAGTVIGFIVGLLLLLWGSKIKSSEEQTAKGRIWGSLGGLIGVVFAIVIVIFLNIDIDSYMPLFLSILGPIVLVMSVTLFMYGKK
jgi:peptidoglycan/LPS O-acetylase OafA/YrhL